jgi:nucleoside-diphosphate-sugar epimerase
MTTEPAQGVAVAQVTEPVLVTGSNGFLGAVLVERLLARGHRDVRCLVRAGSDRARLEAVRARWPDARLQLTVGSLASPDAAARAIEGARVVHHLAASLRGAAADMFLSTVVTSKNLLEAVARMKTPPRLVLVSSFSVYGVADLPRGAVIDESTPIEEHPERRDLYAQVKIRQERLFREYQARHGLPLTVLRPGVIYGPGGSALSVRVGLRLPGAFLHFGGDNLLPLTYVDNCADALVLAGDDPRALGETYNVVDDDLPTCRRYLQLYRKEVEPLRSVSVPYPATMALSKMVERYHRYSKGQLPAILTPYKSATQWKGNRFDNARIKALGWQPRLSTEEGLRRTFEHLRRQHEATVRPA